MFYLRAIPYGLPLRPLATLGAQRHRLVIVHDLFMAALSLALALYLRVGTDLFADYADALKIGIPIFLLVAAVTFHSMGIYRTVWRYASLSEVLLIVKAGTLAILIFLPVMFLATRLAYVPRSVPVIQWFVLMGLLCGPRLLYRLMRTEDAGLRFRRDPAPDGRIPVLLIGACDDAALFIRAVHGSAAMVYRVVGILDDGAEHRGRAIHNVPVLGRTEDLKSVVAALQRQGLGPQRVIIARPDRKLSGESVRWLLDQAEQMGMTVARMPSLVEFKDAARDGKVELRPIALEDLLGRPQAARDPGAIKQLIAGRRILITGAGGSIGGELARQIAALRPAALTLIDSSECNLYWVDLELREQHPHVQCHAVICDIRQREQLERVFVDRRPELVFHAAALKHVPLVERNPSQGILTNVIGTRHVADLAKMHGALAMVQISTDKAVNPTSMMGATKRLAEFYCQALDVEAGANSPADRTSTRFLTVRFGNVLGSSGSVVPLFQRQLEHGGPLTVTHPEITRYFMTVREAAELVLQASAYGIEHAEERGRIFVLDMGQRIRIVDIARQMIRLAGLQPDVDIKLEFVGLRPGEKLFEDLFDDDEQRLPSPIEGLMVAASRPSSSAALGQAFDRLAGLAGRHDYPAIYRSVVQLLPQYRSLDAVVLANASDHLKVAAVGSPQVARSL